MHSSNDRSDPALSRRSTRALLIFGRRPLPGRVKTRLSPALSPDEAAMLYDCMVRDVVARTARLDLDSRFLFYEDDRGAGEYFRSLDRGLVLLPQQGPGLGERLSNAFAEVFGRGYTTVAAVGTDSPDLPAEFITRAFTQLEAGAADVVFGPAEDGGYYLVGLRGENPEIFREVPWSTGQVLPVSLQRAAQAGLRAELLPQWYDIDEPSDLCREDLRTAGHTGAFLVAVSEMQKPDSLLS